MNRLLIVDDDPDVARALERTLSGLSCHCHIVSSAQEAIEALQKSIFGLVLLDLGLPDRDGLATLDAILAHDPTTRVIVVTGYNDAMLAVSAIQRGALDYIVKPWDRSGLLHVVRRALDELQLRREMDAARVRLERDAPQAIGASTAWQRVIEELHAAAQSPRAPVLIAGESGTGKDDAAQLVHRWSPRTSGPFVALNAACLPSSMLESDLFGHEAGAFTGARGQRRGLFELAHGGTLFLDEIGELPIDLQPKLLRVLEGHPFRRLGGEREIKADVRLVAATNRDLPAMIAQGRFREDLYYRLSVLSVSLPPLRDRRGDVRELTLYFASRMAKEMGLADVSIHPDALECLAAHPWPGNVRELRNVVERALVLSRGAVGVCHLPDALRGSAVVATEPTEPRTRTGARATTGVHLAIRPQPVSANEDLSLASAIRQHVLAVYAQHGGNVSRTAASLGITRVGLRRKLREFGVYTRPDAAGGDGTA